MVQFSFTRLSHAIACLCLPLHQMDTTLPLSSLLYYTLLLLGPSHICYICIRCCCPAYAMLMLIKEKWIPFSGSQISFPCYLYLTLFKAAASKLSCKASSLSSQSFLFSTLAREPNTASFACHFPANIPPLQRRLSNRGHFVPLHHQSLFG